METGIIDLHSLVRWAALFGLVISIGLSIIGHMAEDKTQFNFKTLYLFTLIACHLELVVGIATYIASSRIGLFWENPLEMIKNSSLFFYAAIHPLFMITAISLVTLGYRYYKIDNNLKGLKFYSFALILILLAIPWEFSPFI